MIIDPNTPVPYPYASAYLKFHFLQRSQLHSSTISRWVLYNAELLGKKSRLSGPIRRVAKVPTTPAVSPGQQVRICKRTGGGLITNGRLVEPLEPCKTESVFLAKHVRLHPPRQARQHRCIDAVPPAWHDSGAVFAQTLSPQIRTARRSSVSSDWSSDQGRTFRAPAVFVNAAARAVTQTPRGLNS